MPYPCARGLTAPRRRPPYWRSVPWGDRADPVIRAYIATPDSRSRTRRAGSKPDTFGADFRWPGSTAVSFWTRRPLPGTAVSLHPSLRGFSIPWVRGIPWARASSPAPGASLARGIPWARGIVPCARGIVPCARGIVPRAQASPGPGAPPPSACAALCLDSPSPACPLAVGPRTVHHLSHWRIIENYIDPSRLSRSGLIF